MWVRIHSLLILYKGVFTSLTLQYLWHSISKLQLKENTSQIRNQLTVFRICSCILISLNIFHFNLKEIIYCLPPSQLRQHYQSSPLVSAEDSSTSGRAVTARSKGPQTLASAGSWTRTISPSLPCQVGPWALLQEGLLTPLILFDQIPLNFFYFLFWGLFATTVWQKLIQFLNTRLKHLLLTLSDESLPPAHTFFVF